MDRKTSFAFNKVAMKYKCLSFVFAVLLTTVAVNAYSAESKSWHLGVGPSIGILDSEFGYGGTAELLVKVMPETPLYVGLETGLLHFSDSGFGITASLNSIPILPTVTYRFENSSSNMVLYAGLGVGVAVDRLSASIAGFGSGSTTETHFEMLLKPGIEMSSFFIEPKFGVLKDEFIFVATAGYRF